MFATIIFGSPRKAGNTAGVLEAFAGELREQGIEYECFDVYESCIAGCRVCLACQAAERQGEICCAIGDAMGPIYESVAASDLIVVAAPVYIWSVPAPVKAVLDRLTYAACKYYGDCASGESLLEGKRLALITTCGYPIEKGADLLDEAMRRFAKHTKMEYAGMLAERHRNLSEPFMDEGKAERAKDFARGLCSQASR